jgi:hypothetical protein
MDWPDERLLPPALCSHAEYGPAPRLGNMAQPSGNVTAVAAWPVANMAIFIPMYIPAPFPMRRLYWVNGSAITLSCSIGLFDLDGLTIYAGASVAQAGASALQYVTPATPILVAPGWKYIGLTMSGTTASCARGTILTANAASIALAADVGRAMGLRQMASAHPFSTQTPIKATFAQYAQTLFPLVGISRTT